MTRQPIQPLSFGPVAAKDLTWEKKAQSALDDRLQRTRDAAKNWATTIASFTGILGLVALVKGREDISELELWAQILVALALLSAIVAAVFAILYAALASEGTRNKFWKVGSKIEQEEDDEVARAERQLTFSRLLTLAVPVFLVIAVGLTWFAPTATPTPKPAKVLLTMTDGTATCGDLAASTSGRLAVKPKVGATVSISDGTVRSMSVVSACPKAG